MAKTSDVSFHRSMAALHKGGLHRALGIDEKKPIPAEDLEEAKHSDNPHIKKMADLASAMAGWKK